MLLLVLGEIPQVPQQECIYYGKCKSVYIKDVRIYDKAVNRTAV